LVDFTDVLQILNGVSAVAVLLGVVFVVFQLRQNNKIIQASNRQVEASVQQNKSSVVLSMVERFTDDSFTIRRKTIRDIVKKYSGSNWEGFDDTSDDFEVRAFGSYYEFAGYLARTGMVDPEILQNVLGHRITHDWEAMAAAVEYYRQHQRKKYIFANFEWLAGETQKFLQEKEKTL